MTAFQLLIKPSGPDCNLDCTYCFYRRVAGLFPEHSAHRMSEQILEELVSQYLASGFPASVFSWQGGEPTLCGLSFCYGGCQKDRIDSRGEPAPMTYFCSSYKRFFSHSLPRLKTLVLPLASPLAR